MTERGGKAPSTKTVTVEIDYLVIVAKGSAAWKRGAYGNKIEAAILHRRQHGSPAIISEAHWIESLEIPDCEDPPPLSSLPVRDPRARGQGGRDREACDSQNGQFSSIQDADLPFKSAAG